MLDADQLESTSAERYLQDLVDTKLNRSQQCVQAAMKANSILSCTRQSTASRSRKAILPLCRALEGQTWSTVSSSGSTGIGTLWKESNERSHKLWYWRFSESLRDLRLFSLDKGRIRKNTVNEHAYLKRGCKEDGTVPSDRIRGNRYKLQHRKLPQNTRKHLCTVWVTKAQAA